MNTSQIDDVLNFFYSHADERIRDKLFFGNPYAIIAVYICYIVIISYLLPKLMKNKNPVNYRIFMSCVDVILWTRSCYFFSNGFYMWFFKFNWSCQPINQTDSWLSNYEMMICYQFVVTKFVYTLQSVVFVMCKKDKSVGTYLLIHHSIFPLMLWVGANFYPGGHVVFVGFINSIVHLTGATMRIISAIYHESSIRKYSKILDVYMHVSYC
ncbi:hypothetical protein ACKWTF_005603 [Chironomus riparius]